MKLPEQTAFCTACLYLQPTKLLAAMLVRVCPRCGRDQFSHSAEEFELLKQLRRADMPEDGGEE